MPLPPWITNSQRRYSALSDSQTTSSKTVLKPGAFLEEEPGMHDEVRRLQAADDGLFTRLREAMSKIDVAYVATYPPRECGIATFTKDLSTAIDKFLPFSRKIIVAMSRGDEIEQYPREVRFQIFDRSRDSHRAGADFINESSAHIVSLQHEYGIFGGPDGEWVLDFAERLRKPFVVTCHTVLFHPTPNQKRIIQELAALGGRFVVMVELGREILQDVYGIRPEMIALIPHGVPNVHRIPAEVVKRDLGIAGHEVVSTFGLINRGKGIEYAIQAIAEVRKHFPNVRYLVLGETHPGVRNFEGESYRQMLLGMMDELGLHDHVKFNNRFLSLRELVRYLSATDVYVTPYVNRDQIVSGTLAYALGCGRAIVSTRYLYAEEVLADGRGVLVDFRNPDELAKAIIKILGDPDFKESLERAAYKYGRRAAWFNVAVDYISLFREVLAEHAAVEAAGSGAPV